MDGAVCPFDSQLSSVKVWSYLSFLFSAFVISQVCLLPVSPNVSQRQISPFLNKAVLGYYAGGKIQQCHPQEPCLHLKWGERSTEKGRAHKPNHCKYSPLTNFQGLPWDLVCFPCMYCWWVQSFLETFLKGSSSFLLAWAEFCPSQLSHRYLWTFHLPGYFFKTCFLLLVFLSILFLSGRCRYKCRNGDRHRNGESSVFHTW